MTTVDVVYRYATHPTEAMMMALGNAREVYGIRRLVLDHQEKTIRVEYDATRLNAAVVSQLLRRSGISVLNEVPLITPQIPPTPADINNDAAAAK